MIAATIIDSMLRRWIRNGRLSLVYPDGLLRTYGDGSGKEVRVRITSGKWLRRLLDADRWLG